MYTFEEAVEKYKQKLPWGLKATYENNIRRDDHPSYCRQCGWYYPHNNWSSPYCPSCNSRDIVKIDNSICQLGLFGDMF